jgi:hypothetical protein
MVERAAVAALSSTGAAGPSPGETYASRLDARRRELARLERDHRRTARARGVCFVLGVALAYAAFDRAALAPAWLLVPAVAFAALVVRHIRLAAERSRAGRAARYHENGLARLDGTWRDRAPPRDRSGRADLAEHPYAVDLDVVGEGSVFGLLSTAATAVGAETLERWLLEPAPRPEILARQAAVRELTPRLDLREELWVAAASLEAGDDLRPLARWGRPGDDLAPRWVLAATVALASLAVASLIALSSGAVSGRLFVAAALLELCFLAAVRARLAETTRGLDRRVGELRRLAGLLQILERERFDSSRLRELRERLRTAEVPASARIRRLRRLLELFDSGRNLLFLPVALILLWPILVGHFIARWRRRDGAEIAAWIAIAGEVEVLAAFAAHAFDHPDDVFPEIATEGPLFHAVGLAHPLLPADGLVRNDLPLDRDCPCSIVSGSNMSGKSTLLRAVGVNAVLALAGATVRASSLVLSELTVGASLRAQDSLLDGRSRFQAEILRLRRLVELAEGDRPLLFLLDEILGGTNSHDRRIGAEHVLLGLLARGAIGLVTTHDLALAEIAGEATRMRNVHFRDRLEGDRMRFDYRLHPGVVETSNALALMRAIGLEVPEQSS